MHRRGANFYRDERVETTDGSLKGREGKVLVWEYSEACWIVFDTKRDAGLIERWSMLLCWVRIEKWDKWDGGGGLTCMDSSAGLNHASPARGR